MSKSTRSKALTCAFCGTEFPATRSDKRFCCDNHRQAYLRWSLRLSAYEVRANNIIHSVAEYLAYPESKRTALDVLHAVVQLVGTVVEEADEREAKI